MKLHRFYLGSRITRNIQHFGDERMWVQDEQLRHQWERVLKFHVGEDVGLFDDEKEFIYKISEIKPDEICLEKVTETHPKRADKEVLLAWSLLKKDNNDLVLQKATELGAKRLVPILAERSEKTGFDEERATRIVIEASEQCGRVDIPEIDEPMAAGDCINKYQHHYVFYAADERSEESSIDTSHPMGVLIGPEGGWTESELQSFTDSSVKQLHLGNFTLRAETAVIAALSRLLQ